MNLYQVITTNVRMDGQYERAYVWAVDQDSARGLFYQRYPLHEISSITYLFSQCDGAFCTDLSVAGWEMP